MAAVDIKSDTSTVPVRLNLPVDLYRALMSRAADVDLSDYIIRHLNATRDYDNEKGRSVKISPEDRQRIEAAFKRSFRDGRELSNHLLSVCGAMIGGIEVTLSPDLLKRLDGRRGRMELRAFIVETVTRQLEHFTGMR